MPTPSPEHIDLVQRYLFASEEELEEGNVPAAVRERLFRLRDMYMYWLKHVPETAHVTEMEAADHLETL